jgi:hypothetical protein
MSSTCKEFMEEHAEKYGSDGEWLAYAHCGDADIKATEHTTSILDSEPAMMFVIFMVVVIASFTISKIVKSNNKPAAAEPKKTESNDKK